MNTGETSNLPSGGVGIARAAARVVPGRACGTCTLCCKVVGVLEIAKRAGTWCPHCARGIGCTIYDSRYESCRTFYCQWMLDRRLGPEWKPERAKFALVMSEAGRRLTACVDPGYPSAWRRSPYYETLKLWAVEAAKRAPDLHPVDVLIGTHCIVLLADREVDVGTLAPGDKLNYKTTATGEVVEVWID